MSESIVIQQGPLPAPQLILLFHGADGVPQDMLSLGRQLAAEFPQAYIVSVAGLQPSDSGLGRQWFPVQGTTDENRAARVDEAMPGFGTAVRHWQQVSGVGPEATALIGFSQGGTMVLETTRRGNVPAGRIVSIAGRFAELPQHPAPRTTLHLLHGKTDAVVPYAHTVAAAERLVSIGADVTADVIPFVGHGVHAEIVVLLIERLRTYLPRHVWDEALRAADAADRRGGD